MNLPRFCMILCLPVMVALTACGGGGGNSGGGSGGLILSMVESQRYFPLNDGNLWVSREVDSTNNVETANFTKVSQRTGTKLVGGVNSLVVAVTELQSGNRYENYFIKDNNGVTVIDDTTTSSANPFGINNYRIVTFPIQVGATFHQVDKTGIDFGQDLDGDGVNEKLDIAHDVTVRGLEAVTIPAGSFSNCLRLEMSLTETVTLSRNGAKLVVTGVETTWYATDVGPVKMDTLISGGDQSLHFTEELTGYLVDGHASKLSIKATPTTATVNAGSSAQFSATLYDAANSELMMVPAVWSSNDTTIATIDATGLATGNKAGTATLTPSVGGVAGSPATLTVQLGFRPGTNYPVPTGTPYFSTGATAIGDLNGDGRTDVVVLENSGSQLLIYYQNSSGTLDAPQVVTTSLNLMGIVIRDINNDGLADLVVSGNSTTGASGWLGRVTVYQQNMISHTLNAPLEYTISTNTAGTLAIADVNSDGLPDIVVASSGSGGNGRLSFFFQGVGGTLGGEYVYTSVPVYSGGEVHIADMDGDGRNDIVVQSDTKQLAVIKQTSAGVYSSTPDLYAVQTSYWQFFKSFALGDVNGDGRTDMVVADPGNGGYLNIFLQTVSGTFASPQLLTAGYDTQDEVKIADMNSDGRSDIIVLTNGNIVQVNLQTATHTFNGPQTFYLPTHSTGGTMVHPAMAIGDVTGDSLPDVVASWSNEGIYVLPLR